MEIQEDDYFRYSNCMAHLVMNSLTLFNWIIRSCGPSAGTSKIRLHMQYRMLDSLENCLICLAIANHAYGDVKFSRLEQSEVYIGRQVKNTFLVKWSHMPSQLCWQSSLKWYLCFKHIVQSHYYICHFSVCSYGLATYHSNISVRLTRGTS